MAYYGGHDGLEPTDRLVPKGYVGNPWGPAADEARKTGALPPIQDTPLMVQWDQWGRKALKSGDVLFRRGDARLLKGFFPFSRFLANVTGSQFSHVGTAVVENGEPFVYDMTKAGVRRQPFKVWILDNKGPFGVKRLKPEYRDRIPKVVEYLHTTYKKQVPFDYDLGLDDRELYCVEMAEKAFRHAGLVLSEPVLLADMENIEQFPLCILGFTSISNLKLDQAVFFPGNERHGIWSSPALETVFLHIPPSFSKTTPAVKVENPSRTPQAKPVSASIPVTDPTSVAGRPAASKPRN
jgi:hypothetical protein